MAPIPVGLEPSDHANHGIQHGTARAGHMLGVGGMIFAVPAYKP